MKPTFLIILIFISCKITNNNTQRGVVKIYAGYKYKQFPKGGTIASLNGYYSNELTNADMLREKIPINDTATINALFNRLKAKKHHQKKISGVEMAFEFDASTGKGFYVLYAQKLLCVTTQIEYDISPEQERTLLSF